MTARLLELISRERGQALPIVLGAMLVFSISVATVMIYTSESQRAADAQKKGVNASDGAEAALATAISVLASASDATATTDLPDCTTPASVTVAGASGDYCRSLSGSDWTITAQGYAGLASPSTEQIRAKTITEVASIVPVYQGGLGELWNRVYQDDTGHCAVFNKIIVTVPVVTRGCANLTGDDVHPTRLLGASVQIGGNLTLKNIGEDAFVMDKDQAVFQGAVWTAGKCKIGVHASVSAPLICGTLGVKEVDSDNPTVNPWPPSLIGPYNGQVYQNPGADFQLVLGPEFGG
jgi:Tfp pilus assembly protein PilX